MICLEDDDWLLTSFSRINGVVKRKEVKKQKVKKQKTKRISSFVYVKTYLFGVLS